MKKPRFSLGKTTIFIKSNFLLKIIILAAFVFKFGDLGALLGPLGLLFELLGALLGLFWALLGRSCNTPGPSLGTL